MNTPSDRKTLARYGLSVSFLLLMHTAALTMLTVFRVVQLIVLGHMRQTDDSALPALLRGVWFDNVVGCYILVLPLAVVLTAASLGSTAKPWRRFAAWFCGVPTVLAMAVAAANIPYFSYFFRPINSSIFGWFGYAGTTAGMLVGEWSYVLYILLFVVAVAVYTAAVVGIVRLTDRLIAKAAPPAGDWKSRTKAAVLTVLLTALCVFGIRGRMGYNPIKISQAYYCGDAFLNQLGVSPAYYLLTSVMDDMRPENEALRLMDQRQAVDAVRRWLKIDGPVDSAHVLRRVTAGRDSVLRCNVVIILMESMSADLVGALGGRQGLTPTLDSLCHSSLVFTRCYSSGIHTNHGITASLYSFPALMKRNLMKGTVTPHRKGLPTVLHDAGWHTMFFMTHEAQYDNMNAFLRTNGYDDIFAESDYPASERVNAFGVPDRYLFGYALNAIDRVAADGGKPFMATILTVSNHPPFIVPADLVSKQTDPEYQIVEYADRSIGEFLAAARRKPWFDNTLFVLLGDHGKLVAGDGTELPDSYNHIPLIISGPGVQAARNNALATQTDIMPTVLGLMGVGYTSDAFGTDLLIDSHDVVCYTADEQIVARDSTRRFVLKPATGQRFCYRVADDGRQTAAGSTETFADLEQAARAFIQTAWWVEQRRKESME